MSGHTKEPWMVAEHNPSIVRMYPKEHEAKYADAPYAALGGTFSETREANARRIVAAVNAVAGMPQADLEELAAVEGGVMVLAVYADDMRQQRDKLLAVLEAIERYNTPLPHGLLEQARAAIATAKVQS